MKVGYARVSTEQQSITAQYDALREAGCTQLFGESCSGGDGSKLVELRKALDYLREGDTFVIWKLDRIGRTARDILNVLAEIEKKKVTFLSLTDSIDTTTPAGRTLLNVFASFAQLERDLISERTKSGISAAKARGVRVGRIKKIGPSGLRQIEFLIRSGVPIKEVAGRANISVSTLYRYIPRASTLWLEEVEEKIRQQQNKEPQGTNQHEDKEDCDNGSAWYGQNFAKFCNRSCI